MTPAAPSTWRRCGAIEGIDGRRRRARTRGFAANVNRGLRATRPDRDVVVLNSDIEALAGLARVPAVRRLPARTDVGIVGAQLLYPDGRIQFGGTVRNLDAPEWFDHRYRFKPADWGPAGAPAPALAVTGACMYVRREVIERVGLLDERYPMAYEDVDWCLRAWQAGFARALLPGRAARPPRVGHARHRGGRARARLPARSSGSAGRTSSTRATCAPSRSGGCASST